jgi:hypothetical protein
MTEGMRRIERSEVCRIYPAKLMGDSPYGAAEMLGWLVHEHGIEPHVTVFDKSARHLDLLPLTLRHVSVLCGL